MHSLMTVAGFFVFMFLIGPALGCVLGQILVGCCELLAWLTGANKYQAPPLEPTSKAPETRTVLVPETPWTYHQMLQHQLPEGMSAADRAQKLWKQGATWRKRDGN